MLRTLKWNALEYVHILEKIEYTGCMYARAVCLMFLEFLPVDQGEAAHWCTVKRKLSGAKS